MNQYFIHNGQETTGPFTHEELSNIGLKPETPVWREGLGDWTPAKSIDELKDLVTPKVVPPPYRPAIPTPPPIPNAAPSYAQQMSSRQSGASHPLQDNRQAVDRAKPKRKKKLFVALVTITALAVAGVIGWLIYQQQQQEEYIGDLNYELSSTQYAMNTQANSVEEAENNRRAANAALTEKNMNLRNNWSQYITLDRTEPNIDQLFGGISEFTVFVANTTPYMLDQVDVDVTYYKKNGGYIKSEVVRVFNVGANSSQSGLAPASPTGTRVETSISRIVSKKMHFCYPDHSGNDGDPYFCR